MLESFKDAFATYPIQVIALVSLIPILFMMLYERRQAKKNPMISQIQAVLKKGQPKNNILVRGSEIINKRLGERGDKIQLKLERSNIPFKKEEYLSVMVMGIIGGFFVGFLIFPLGSIFHAFTSWMGVPVVELFFARLLDGIAFSGLGYFVPEVYLAYLTSQRRKLTHDQIEDALLNMADAIRSGMNINEALRIVGEELKYPLGDEFARAYQEYKSGKPIQKALEDLKIRIDLKDFTIAINAIQIQLETGASLEPLLRNMVKIIGDRKVLKKEIEKAVSSSKMQGIILMVAPLLLVMMFSSMNGETYIQMLKDPMGIVMILVAAGSYILGSGIILYIIREVSKLQ